MRFRVKRGGPAAGFTFDRTAKPVQRPEPEKPVSLAQALDNPYGRYYGKARSREELLKNRYGVLAQLGEHLPYKQRVTGSSPVGPILMK